MAGYCNGKSILYILSSITTFPSSLPWWLLLKVNKKKPGRWLIDGGKEAVNLVVSGLGRG